MYTYTCADKIRRRYRFTMLRVENIPTDNILTENLHIFIGALLNYLGQDYYSGVIMVQNFG